MATLIIESCLFRLMRMFMHTFVNSSCARIRRLGEFYLWRAVIRHRIELFSNLWFNRCFLLQSPYVLRFSEANISTRSEFLMPKAGARLALNSSRVPLIDIR